MLLLGVSLIPAVDYKIRCLMSLGHLTNSQHTLAAAANSCFVQWFNA